LDALSLSTCEDVCPLWRDYIRGERIWRRVATQNAKQAPELVRANGWKGRLEEAQACVLAEDRKESEPARTYRDVMQSA